MQIFGHNLLQHSCTLQYVPGVIVALQQLTGQLWWRQPRWRSPVLDKQRLHCSLSTALSYCTRLSTLPLHRSGLCQLPATPAPPDEPQTLGILQTSRWYSRLQSSCTIAEENVARTFSPYCSKSSCNTESKKCRQLHVCWILANADCQPAFFYVRRASRSRAGSCLLCAEM